MPGSFQAVYNGTKGLREQLRLRVRNEIKDTDVTVTCLIRGRPLHAA
jgi:hypothetical protein